MIVTIEDSGSKIIITTDDKVRDILKSWIREVEVIKTNIIKIDIGRTPLENIFIVFEDVTSPSVGDPSILRDTIVSYLESTPGSKESHQIDQNAILSSIKVSSLDVDNKAFFQPLIIDQSISNTVYKGYAPTGSAAGSPVWAIEKIITAGGIETHLWANGGKDFKYVWESRTGFSYK